MVECNMPLSNAKLKFKCGLKGLCLFHTTFIAQNSATLYYLHFTVRKRYDVSISEKYMNVSIRTH